MILTIKESAQPSHTYKGEHDFKYVLKLIMLGFHEFREKDRFLGPFSFDLRSSICY